MSLLTLKDQQRIDAMIENLRMKTGLSFPEGNLVELAKSLGVEVYESKFIKHDSIDGFLEYPKKSTDTPKIYLNKNRPSERKKFTLAHEIGHYLLHHDTKGKYRIDGMDYSQNDDETREETEANYFAASLLVPEEKLRSFLQFAKGNIELAAKYFGVSKPVIENRIKWLQKNT
ncbi:ImmA/IrrE family metallo-endopeptidase [Candidatus Woesebacteria bacterium]|nr:ImmA/IrrE family metallo-endopeptidase [Candidatus Woesebacteria bacterium]